MSHPTLAVFAASSAATDDALEFLRVVAALAACGHPVHLFAVGAGARALAAEDLPDEVERYLDALAALGIAPTSGNDAALPAAIGAADWVLRFGDATRSARPDVLRVDGTTGSAALFDAGQVFRAADEEPR